MTLISKYFTADQRKVAPEKIKIYPWYCAFLTHVNGPIKVDVALVPDNKIFPPQNEIHII